MPSLVVRGLLACAMVRILSLILILDGGRLAVGGCFCVVLTSSGVAATGSLLTVACSYVRSTRTFRLAAYCAKH
jgi:hypothetical protein